MNSPGVGWSRGVPLDYLRELAEYWRTATTGGRTRPGELGVTDRKLAPDGLGTGPAGPVTYWQVDDLAAAFDRPLSLGATPLQPPTELSRGFMIASVVDPFGNVLGLRFDPHFLEDVTRAGN